MPRIFRYDLRQEKGYFTATCRENKRLSVAVRAESALAREVHKKLERRFLGCAAFMIENPWASKADMAFAVIHSSELKAHLSRYYATHGK